MRQPFSRPRRAAIRIVTICIAALLGAATVVIGPGPLADAVAPSLSVRAVGGDRQITAAWTSIPGASGYTVRWGAGTSTTHVVHTVGNTVRIGKVKDGSRYSVRVAADGTSAQSARVTATPTPYSPVPVTDVTAVPAGANQIKVSWKGGGRARSVAVYVGADSQTKTHHYATAWHPAALSSWTVTLPANLRGVLGAGTGNPVFVRVVQTNSTARTPKMEWTFNSSTKFRLSTVGPWTLAGAASTPLSPANASALTIASWNAQSISVSKAFSPTNRWAARLPKVVANLQDLHPDVIAFQELGTSRVDPECRNSPSRMAQGVYDCDEQYQTLERAVASTSATVSTVYRDVRSDADAYVYQQEARGNTGNFVDSSIFYNPDAVEVLSSGFVSPRSIMGAQWGSSLPDEAGVWAEMQTTDSAARRFLITSIHMPATGPSVATVRRDEGTRLATWLDEKAAQLGGIPIVIAGDFNGNGTTDSDAASLRMVAQGYVDAAATLDRTDIRWATDNLTNGPDAVDEGYPRTAVPHPHVASRIDYIMVKGGIRSSRYRNEVRFTTQANGVRRFDTRFQGSDHNMQLASLAIPGAARS